MTDASREIAPPAPPSSLTDLVGGDLVATPAATGRRVVVSFRGAYELFIAIDGRSILPRLQRSDRRPLIQLVRRVPALFNALEQNFALVLDAEGDGRLVVRDIFDRVGGRYLASAELQQRLGRIDLPVAPFAFVGTPDRESELLRQLEHLTAMGNALEIRREEDGEVKARVLFTREALVPVP